MKNIITRLLTLAFFLFLIHPAYSQKSIDGSWSGAISIMGSELGIGVKFKTDSDSIRGTIDIPQQNAKDLKLIHVEFTPPKVYFELPAGPGLAVFDGKLEGDSITGKFTQSGMEGRFHLQRGELKTQQKEVTEVLPYNSEDVSFTNGDIKFAGTLTIPKTEGKHPAVVMITGSGPQNRDEELFGFKPFKIIADYLTKNGIAVLRYDDRGVGGSTGENVSEYTTEDFAGDVIEAVNYLKTRNDINPSQIGLMGHSEGGIVAPIAASKSTDIAFIILMAGTGVKGIDILKEQTALIMKSGNASEKEIKENAELLDKIYKACQTGEGWDEIRNEYARMVKKSMEQMTDEEKKAIKDKDEYAKTMTEARMKQMQSVWMKYFITYDPAPTLEKVKCPVLMLFGELDLQVPPAQNKEPMENALQKGGNKDFKTFLFPKANHLFQQAITGSPTEYAKLPKEFVPSFLDTVKEWITKRVTLVK